jgi:hypothetical protein
MVIVVGMLRKTIVLTLILTISLFAVACNYPGYSNGLPEPTPTNLPALPLEPGLDPFSGEPEGNCASALTPGIWSGSASINSAATSMGFRVINQNVSIPLQLAIDCDGSITGTAQRVGEGDIRVPFALDGACTENAGYQVEGVVLPADGNTGPPTLRLTFFTLQGSLSCNLNSRISDIPSGEQNWDFTGSSFDIDLVPESVTSNRISGSHWPDSLYQDQFDGLEEMLDENNVETTTTSSWELVLQR